MGKKKSSGSKKKQSLAMAVEQAEQEVGELKLDEDDTKKARSNNKDEEGIKKVEEKNEDEFQFDYTAGENLGEENDNSNGLFT